MKQEGKTWVEIGDKLNVNSETLRTHARRQEWYKDIKEADPHVVEEGMEYSTTEQGVYQIDKEFLFDEERLFSNEELLRMNNLDPDEFELLRIRRGKWSVTIKDGQRKWNFQSRIDAKPRDKGEFTPEQMAKVFESVKPLDIPLLTDEVLDQYLYVPLADMHFGLNTLFDYADLQCEIAEVMKNGYAEITLSINGDYLHVDNFLNTTERGTHVGEFNHIQAVNDGYDFLIPLIKCALENSPNVKLVYLKGNHAPAQDYMLIQGIKRLFPQISVDDSLTEVKHTWLGTHSLFLHHGDKIKNIKRLHEVVTSKYAKEWGSSQSRYLFTAHLHHEKALSFGGMTHYQLQSPSKPSTYDETYGFDTSESGLTLYEFDKQKRRAIYYL